MKPLKTGGVFAVSRAIFDDPDFANEPFTQREAFMWLVANAAWKDHKTRGTRGVVTLKRGEFCFAIRYLAERWQWSKSRVERFISALKNRDTIEDTKRDGEQVYFIKKYNEFQVIGLPSRDAERDTNRDSSGTAAGQERDKEETGKHLNIKSSSSLRSEARAKGTRLPDDWRLDDLSRQHAVKLGLSPQQVETEADKFRDYWRSTPGQKGVKLDWPATWRNWIRNTVERQQRSQAPPRKTAHREHQDACHETMLREIYGDPFDEFTGTTIEH